MLALRSHPGCTCSTSYRAHGGRFARPAAAHARAAAPRRTALRAQALLKEADGVSASWTQTPDDVLIRVPVDASVRGRDISFEVHPKRLSLAVDGKQLLAGNFAGGGDVNADESFWTLEKSDEESGGGRKYVAITLAKKSMGYNSWEMLLESERVDATVTDRVWMQVAIGGQVIGKMVIALFGKVAPKTVDNFKSLATGDKGVGPSGKPLHYKGVRFHRIITEFMAQGGDTTLGNGFGGESIYGDKFEDESFKMRHEERGCVAMANAGPNTNGSQFYICFGPAPHLDGKHVVFGRIEAGLELLGRMEAVGDESGTPSDEVVVVDCGLLLGGAGDVEGVVDENKQLTLAQA
ncbi:hypothetical protein FOA52_008147 [Chlamydomonas sp. UWO 241]|nr:hypothetical protein FOA52_008147 [Chlamydomonas sp. UWO 241]